MACLRSRAPGASSANVRKVMLANLGGSLEPERKLRSELHKAGFRFRRNTRPVIDFRCEADILFPTEKVCVFVDGCFWHGCPRHFVCPKTNKDWWAEKIEINQTRDCKHSAELLKRGWRPIRIWEHSIRDNVHDVVEMIRSELLRRRLCLRRHGCAGGDKPSKIKRPRLLKNRN